MKRLILLLTALLTLSCAGAQEAKTTKEQKILEQAIKANTVEMIMPLLMAFSLLMA